MKSLAVFGLLLCLVGWLGMACQSPPATLTRPSLPTVTPIPTHTPTPTPTPTPGPLAEAEAVALVREEMAARGVALHTLRIRIAGQPRWVSIRYSSAYDVDSSVFQAQTVLVALAAARAIVRVDPPINGGMRLAVIPAGEGEIGLRVTTIDRSSLKAWADGSLSDREFVAEWSVGSVTRE